MVLASQSEGAMPRTGQQRASRGSQKWLQRCMEQNAGWNLSEAVAEPLGLAPSEVEWLSPLPADNYAEYSDDAFLERLGARLERRPLGAFWPRRGPVWDGLGRTRRGDLLLVEAKAHIREMVSPASQASAASLARINTALNEVRNYLGSSNAADWAGTFYQYTNRLAHLYLLRVVNSLPASLVFVHFVGDLDMAGPASREEWEGAIKVMKTVLGLRDRHPLAPHVLDVFMHVDRKLGSA
jgi:hypothetical protein